MTKVIQEIPNIDFGSNVYWMWIRQLKNILKSSFEMNIYLHEKFPWIKI